MVMENGSKEQQLKANIVTGKILLKMATLKFEGKSSSSSSFVDSQEESKIADE